MKEPQLDDMQQLLRAVTRRHFFRQTGFGIGAAALTAMMNRYSWGADLPPAPAAPGAAVNPMAPKPPMFAPKAKNIIYMFMAGAPKQVHLRRRTGHEHIDDVLGLGREHGRLGSHGVYGGARRGGRRGKVRAPGVAVHHRGQRRSADAEPRLAKEVPPGHGPQELLHVVQLWLFHKLNPEFSKT